MEKDKLIIKHIAPLFGSAEIASIEYFLQTGKVNGNFRNRLHALIDEVASLTVPELLDGNVYKRDDLISFGKYLLSKERRDLIKFHPELEDKHFLQRYSSVSDADIANWKDNKLFKNP